MKFSQGALLAGGRYELRERIGAGGMATVWLAHDTRLDRRVAIKIPAEQIAADQTFATRFEREARIAAGLSHPNLVSIYDVGSEADRPFLVMQYVEGETLGERLDRGESVDPRALAVGLLGALEHIHAAGIVHRDVKLGNVLIGRGEQVMLTDFGIAQAADHTQLTGTNEVIGTLRYMAPEIIEGERATPRSDLYSCGVVLRECLADGDARDLWMLADSLTAKDPGERPGSAASALASIRTGPFAGEATEQTEPAAERTERRERPAPPAVPRPALAASASPVRTAAGPSPRAIVAGLAALLVAAVVAVIALSGGDGGQRERLAGGNSAEAPAGGGDGAEATTEQAPSEEQAPAQQSGAAIPTSDDPDPELGRALNDKGYQQLQSADYEQAVSTLREAVAAFPPDSTDINYAYALFNYGQALRLSGDPEAAIPVLEKRLEFNNQRGTVRRELKLAQQEASS